MGIYATTVNIVTANVGSPDGKGIQVALVDSASGEARDGQKSDAEPWNALGGNETSLASGAVAAVAPLAIRPLDLAPTAEIERQTSFAPSLPMPAAMKPLAPPAEDAGPPELAFTKNTTERIVIKSAEPFEHARQRKRRPTTFHRPTRRLSRRTQENPPAVAASQGGGNSPLAGPSTSPGAKDGAAGSPDGTVWRFRAR